MSARPFQIDGNRKNKQCNCKNSRCLKLYCECFASGVYCNPNCNCTNCCNNEIQDAVRKEAIESILERNPDAFRPKIQEGASGKHNKGCACKRSFCLKRYCECYQAGILCSENCKCNDCKNFKESDDRKALLSTDTHGPVQPGMPAAKKMRIGEPPGMYGNIVDSPQGPMIAPPQQPMQVPLPLIVQIVNQQLVENLCTQLVNVVHAPEHSVKLMLAQGGALKNQTLHGNLGTGPIGSGGAAMLGTQGPGLMPGVAAANAAAVAGGTSVGVGPIGAAMRPASTGGAGSSVENLPALNTAAVPQTTADALVCHEKIGPSPSPPTKFSVAPSPPAPVSADVKPEPPTLDANGLPTHPSSWYIGREKLVLSEFHKCLAQLAGVMREKVAEREAKRLALAAQMMPRSMASNMTSQIAGMHHGNMGLVSSIANAGLPGGLANLPGFSMAGGMYGGIPSTAAMGTMGGMVGGTVGVLGGVPGMAPGVPNIPGFSHLVSRGPAAGPSGPVPVPGSLKHIGVGPEPGNAPGLVYGAMPTVAGAPASFPLPASQGAVPMPAAMAGVPPRTAAPISLQPGPSAEQIAAGQAAALSSLATMAGANEGVAQAPALQAHVKPSAP